MQGPISHNRLWEPLCAKFRYFVFIALATLRVIGDKARRTRRVRVALPQPQWRFSLSSPSLACVLSPHTNPCGHFASVYQSPESPLCRLKIAQLLPGQQSSVSSAPHLCIHLAFSATPHLSVERVKHTPAAKTCVLTVFFCQECSLSPGSPQIVSLSPDTLS